MASRAPPSSGGSRKISFNVSEQYDIQDVVGEGAYGVVCSALHKPSGQKVAIKKITPFGTRLDGQVHGETSANDFVFHSQIIACSAYERCEK
jgi:hypothetical protein